MRNHSHGKREYENRIRTRKSTFQIGKKWMEHFCARISRRVSLRRRVSDKRNRSSKSVRRDLLERQRLNIFLENIFLCIRSRIQCVWVRVWRTWNWVKCKGNFAGEWVMRWQGYNFHEFRYSTQKNTPAITHTHPNFILFKCTKFAFSTWFSMAEWSGWIFLRV